MGSGRKSVYGESRYLVEIDSIGPSFSRGFAADASYPTYYACSNLYLYLNTLEFAKVMPPPINGKACVVQPFRSKFEQETRFCSSKMAHDACRIALSHCAQAFEALLRY